MAVYPERESNPHGHRCPRDFKSRVSTYSTIRAFPVKPCKYSKYSMKTEVDVLPMRRFGRNEAIPEKRPAGDGSLRSGAALRGEQKQ